MATANKMRTWPNFRARTVTRTYRSLMRESLGEEYLLTSSCSFIANKLSYSLSLNSSEVLESEVFKIISRRAIENVNFTA